MTDLSDLRQTIARATTGDTVILARSDADALIDWLEAAEAALARVDAVLARRPALADQPDRYTKIAHAISVAAERDRLKAALEPLEREVSNLQLANSEARRTIDRLCAEIPREANDGSASI